MIGRVLFLPMTFCSTIPSKFETLLVVLVNKVLSAIVGGTRLDVIVGIKVFTSQNVWSICTGDFANSEAWF